jgi:hypothetical protein
MVEFLAAVVPLKWVKRRVGKGECCCSSISPPPFF